MNKVMRDDKSNDDFLEVWESDGGSTVVALAVLSAFFLVGLCAGWGVSAYVF